VSLPVKPYVRELEPYQPGKPIEELERELGISEAVKLASNENPLGPSPLAVAAVAKASSRINRYPDGSCFRLRRALAERLDVAADQLVFGCGSDEVLDLAAKAYLGPGDEIVYAWPSFAMYPLVAQGIGATPVPVPLDADLVHDLGAMRAAVTQRTRVVIVCNPNNPTGTSVGAAAFDAFVESLPADVILLLDEAYVEYAARPDFPDALGWVRRRPGTAVLRTFSKIHGLAGLRIGYAVCDPELADHLERVRHPFNVNLLAEEGALAALDDADHVERSRALNREGAGFLERELQRLGLRTVPTDANFILAETGAGSFEMLLQQGVIVRPMDGFGLPGFVRISIGTGDENQRVITALEEMKRRERAA